MPNSADSIVRICVVSGSTRPGNYTGMAVNYVAELLSERPEISVEKVFPESLDLPFPGAESSTADQQWLCDRILEATGLILATPEYHGSFSSVMKLIIENLGFPSLMAGKPVALLGVAGGSIGAIKSLEQLRSVCSHVGAIVLPGPVSISNVRSMFSPGGELLDERTGERLRQLVTNMLDYIDQNICPRYTLEAMVREASF